MSFSCFVDGFYCVDSFSTLIHFLPRNQLMKWITSAHIEGNSSNSAIIGQSGVERGEGGLVIFYLSLFHCPLLFKSQHLHYFSLSLPPFAKILNHPSYSIHSILSGFSPLIKLIPSLRNPL